eukprot:CAMPEP_0119559476 /NCGR_PEP_ID=MMETSP1352-20130426/12703_1 /TAXON_ID=265584 /ORGANISM="Stauroneis constricta, Strain CCMP1120" /LENGTH=47 /DNA_ID= /DNA_START= /DNA_END= /DNA_ORIENTATION=
MSDDGKARKRELKSMPSNAELLENVSQGHKEEPQMWGVGVMNDIKRT